MWFGYESQRLEKILHPISALPPHGLGDMSVTVQRESRGIVSGILLDCFYIVSSAKSIDHICMSKLVEAENSTFSVEAENEICYNVGRL